MEEDEENNTQTNKNYFENDFSGVVRLFWNALIKLLHKKAFISYTKTEKNGAFDILHKNR
jgi:hypothetical protein